MSALETLLAHRAVPVLGWPLLHFVWQGALVAAVYAGAEQLLLRRAPATTRYAAACAGLLLMLACPIVTLLWLNSAPTTATHTQAMAESVALPAAHNAQAETMVASLVAPEQAVDLFDGAYDAHTSLRLWAAERFPVALPWLVLAWALGTSLSALRLAGGFVLAERLKREPAPLAARVWQETLTRLRQRLRVSRPVRLCTSALVEVPTVIGCLRPVILLPVCALTNLSAPQLEALIAHELAHVRRHDYLINLLQSLIETLLFYHPAVWWLSRRVRAEREHCCDDLAVAATGDVLVYARALTMLETLRRRTGVSLVVAANGGSLMTRIQRLLQPQMLTPQRTPTSAVLALTLVALLSIFAGAQTLSAFSRYDAPETQKQPAPLKAKRKVAVTFVSLPAFQTYYNPRAVRDQRKLIDSLHTHGVPAIGFVGESGLYTENGQLDDERVQLLRNWLDAGFELGTQTYSHQYLYKTPLAQFEQNVMRGEEVTSRLLRERGQQLRYFSYPFLNTGPDRATKEAFEKFLAEHGLRIHQVTIDNMDWLFGQAWADARREEDEETMKRVAGDYVPYMERMFEFDEQLARDTLGYEPPQVLMLMASGLNAAKLDDLLTMLERRGYQFVTLDEAQSDPAYSLPDTYTGPVGISWLQRWAMTKGAPFRKEPYLSPYMQQYDFRQSGSDFKTSKQ
ncbi:MAG: M56 family metallopeptidase [Pyrinomonadaceae bacterium]